MARNVYGTGRGLGRLGFEICEYQLGRTENNETTWKTRCGHLCSNGFPIGGVV